MRRLVRQLRGSLDVKPAADLFKAVDTALGCPHPTLRRPACYIQLAEEAIGRLDPTIVAVAEHEGGRALHGALMALDRAHSPEEISAAIREAFRRGLRKYHDILGGRDHNHGEGATDAQRDGR